MIQNQMENFWDWLEANNWGLKNKNAGGGYKVVIDIVTVRPLSR